MFSKHIKDFFVVKLVRKVLHLGRVLLARSLRVRHDCIVAEVVGAPERTRTASSSLGRNCFIH